MLEIQQNGGSARSRWTRRGWLGLTLFSLLIALTGCGGGSGGGNPQPGQATSVTGRVLRAENNAPEPGATVKVGSKSTTTDTNGAFTLSSVDANAKTATITPAAPAKARTLTLALTARAVNNLGDIFVSDTGYTSSAIGTVVAQTAGSQQPVGNVTVTIAGSQVKSGTDGKFRIDNLPIGLGADPNAPIGTITATDFEPKSIFTQFPLVAGDNDLGTLLLGAPVGNTPPALPYTIKGAVTLAGNPAPSINVTLSANGTFLGATQTDTSGNYTFWVVPGTYVITASNAGSDRTVTVTLAAPDTPVTAPAIAF